MPLPRVAILLNISQTLARFQISLQPSDTLIILERMLSSIENKLGELLDTEIMAGLLFHLVCSQVPERLRAMHLSTIARDYLESRFPGELGFCLQAIHKANQQLYYPIPEVEAYNILGILKQVDIFIEVEGYPLASL